MLKQLLLSSIICISSTCASGDAVKVDTKVAKSVMMLDIIKKRDSCSGSAVAITKDYIITNGHVLEGIKAGVIILDDTELDISKIMFYEAAFPDLAIIYFPDHGIPFVALAAKEPVRGQDVYACGFPLGISKVISQGIWNGISVIRDLPYGLYTAATSPGSSGGGVFNQDGELVGLTCANFHEGQNMNLCVPLCYIKEAIKHADKKFGK